MESTTSSRLAGAFFFLGVMVFGFFLYQAARSDPSVHAAPESQGQTTAADSKPILSANKFGERISMQVGQAVVIGRSKIVFRGVAEGRVLFDHYLLDYNSHYAFAYAVPEAEARDGFKIGDHAFKVTYAGGQWVHFKLVQGLPAAAG